jgi:hypothetical protein
MLYSKFVDSTFDLSHWGALRIIEASGCGRFNATTKSPG